MMSRTVLGIDIGTTAIKMTLLEVLDRTHTRIIKEESCPHNLISLHPGWAEEDALVWKEHLIKMLRMLSDEIEVSSLEAISVTGMTPALILLDEEGVPLRYAILQNDMRTSEEIRYLQENLEKDDTYFRLTGCHVNSQNIAPRMLYLYKHERALFDRIWRICGSYDYASFILTGSLVCERNWALESGLFSFDDELLEGPLSLSHIRREWLSPLKDPRDRAGLVSEEIAEATGIPAGTAVYAGTADHVASSYSSGAKEDEALVLKLGGAGDILLSTKNLALDDRLFIDRSPSEKAPWLINGCTAASGSLLKWFVREFGGNYKELDDEAERIAAGSDGIVILPYVLGEKTPIFDPEARGVIYGLLLNHTKAHIYRAMMEATAYAFRHHLDIFRELGLQVKKVYITNGGSTSPLWRQIMADVLKTDVAYIKHNPGSSLGAAFIAGEAHDLIDDAAIDEFLSQKIISYSNEENHAAYDRGYRIYRELYPRLKELEKF